MQLSWLALLCFALLAGWLPGFGLLGAAVGGLMLSLEEV